MDDEDLDDNVLKRVIASRTKGGFHNLDTPKQFAACVNGYIESGPSVLTFTLTFREALEDVVKLARGIHISDDTDINDPPGNAKYTLLLLGPDLSSRRNYLIPCCQTLNPITDNFEKRTSYNQTINFAWQEADPNIQLEYMGTAAELKTILGARSPI